MPKEQTLSISETTLKRLRGETIEERALHRLHCVALVLGGMPAKDVAALYGDSPRAVAYWVKKFQSGGYENLFERQRPGRPSRLDIPQMKKIRSFVVKERNKEKGVNAGSLSAYIKASFNVSLTERQCWRILKGIT